MGEEDIIGPCVFGGMRKSDDPLANRSLLIQLCERHHLEIANTYFEHEPARKVTYHEWGMQAVDFDITCKKFAQFDFFLVEDKHIGCFEDIYSDCFNGFIFTTF